MLEWILKITPMTEFEVINRFVDVDGTNKIIRGVRGIVRILEVMFFCRCRWAHFPILCLQYWYTYSVHETDLIPVVNGDNNPNLSSKRG